MNPDIRIGSSYNYKFGYPVIHTETFSYVSEDENPYIEIITVVDPKSLLFRDIQNVTMSELHFDVSIDQICTENINCSDLFSEKKNYSYTIINDTLENYKMSDPRVNNIILKVPYGSFDVTLTVTEIFTGKQIIIDRSISTPNLKNNEILFSSIKMMVKDNQDEIPSWTPLTTYDVPSRYDSLKFITQAIIIPEKGININSNLIKFQSDSSIARPLYYTNYSRTTIEYRGLNYTNYKTYDSSERNLGGDDKVLIEYKFGNLKKGNYRFEIQENNKVEGFFKARDFGVKSENYPNLFSPKELAYPLIYIMNESDYKDLINIKDQDSLKLAVDLFWLNNFESSYVAKDVMELYYSRVERANKLFSNFKEGWKTDLGMVYILFGEPYFSNLVKDELTWAYSKNVVYGPRRFVFKRPRTNSDSFHFTHFLLQRDNKFYQIEYQQKQTWLNGLILQRRY